MNCEPTTVPVVTSPTISSKVITLPGNLVPQLGALTNLNGMKIAIPAKKNATTFTLKSPPSVSTSQSTCRALQFKPPAQSAPVNSTVPLSPGKLYYWRVYFICHNMLIPGKFIQFVCWCQHYSDFLCSIQAWFYPNSDKGKAVVGPISVEFVKAVVGLISVEVGVKHTNPLSTAWHLQALNSVVFITHIM